MFYNYTINLGIKAILLNKYNELNLYLTDYDCFI